MNYRSYEICAPDANHRDWHGLATLKDTDSVCAASQGDLYSQIDGQMNEYLETHSPFTFDHDDQARKLIQRRGVQ